MKENEITTVVFLMEEMPNSVLAVFPKTQFDGSVDCYSHVGQHSTAKMDYIKGLKRARRTDFIALQRELEREGYNLYVLNGKRIINQIITPVNGKYGAPHGRPSVGTAPKDGTRIYDQYIPMSEPAYDRGGAYWGIPNNVRVKFTKDLSYIEFYRPE